MDKQNICIYLCGGGGGREGVKSLTEKDLPHVHSALPFPRTGTQSEVRRERRSRRGGGFFGFHRTPCDTWKCVARTFPLSRSLSLSCSLFLSLCPLPLSPWPGAPTPRFIGRKRNGWLRMAKRESLSLSLSHRGIFRLSPSAKQCTTHHHPTPIEKIPPPFRRVLTAQRVGYSNGSIIITIYANLRSPRSMLS